MEESGAVQLGFGSDTGFEVNGAQIEIMQVFASILALAAEAKNRDKGKAALS